MNYFDAWTLVAILFTFNVAFFSYRAGHKVGIQEGVDATLDSLEAQGVITVEDPSEED
jgi:hypothetical protein